MIITCHVQPVHSDVMLLTDPVHSVYCLVLRLQPAKAIRALTTCATEQAWCQKHLNTAQL